MLGLRAARLVFRKPGAATSVTLLPMVHVGDATFYDAIQADALGHDVVLFEGVRSPVGRHLTRSYRWIDLPKLGLVLQPRLRADGNVNVRLLHADLSTDEFHACWRDVPIWLKLTVALGAPLVGLQRRLFATRESLAERMSLEDRLSPDEILDWDPSWAAFFRAIGDVRDERLVKVLGEQLDHLGDGGNRLAVVYGAMHMRAVRAELSRRGFVCVESEWRTIIAL